jgi:hypothetical protein
VQVKKQENRFAYSVAFYFCYLEVAAAAVEEVVAVECFCFLWGFPEASSEKSRLHQVMITSQK